MTSLIDICNAALAEIAAGPIASMTEGSIESREANRFYPLVLAELALWTDWSWAIDRAVLVEATNDRPAEWLHAYTLPGDCVHPLSIRQVEAAATALPLGGPFPFPVQDALPLAFLNEGGLLYTNVPSATLVYVSRIADPTTLPPLVRRAFELELAARIAIPIRKDAALAQRLGSAAEMARARAIAADFNQRDARPAEFVSAAAYARFGIGSAL